MVAIQIREPALAWSFGDAARAHIRREGLRVDDIGLLVGASGGPKWLVLAGLDRYLFSAWLQQRTRPLDALASSIGSWRFACLAQRDPVAALDRFLDIYLQQSYSENATAADVSRVLDNVLSHLLGPAGVAEILAHPFVRNHIVTVRAKGLLASEVRWRQALGLGASFLANALSHDQLHWFFERAVFADGRSSSDFDGPDGIASRRIPLQADNLELALRASGAVPLVLSGIADIPGAAPGIYRDGGVIDYHFDYAAVADRKLVFYPHFYSHSIPGWFDKALKWRHQSGSSWRNTVMVAPSPAFVAALPGGKIPDRKDFFAMGDAERVRYWKRVVDESQRLADAFQDVVERDRIGELVAR